MRCISLKQQLADLLKIKCHFCPGPEHVFLSSFPQSYRIRRMRLSPPIHCVTVIQFRDVFATGASWNHCCTLRLEKASKPPLQTQQGGWVAFRFNPQEPLRLEHKHNGSPSRGTWSVWEQKMKMKIVFIQQDYRRLATEKKNPFKVVLAKHKDLATCQNADVCAGASCNCTIMGTKEFESDLKVGLNTCAKHFNLS